jgi:hypothetical protein
VSLAEPKERIHFRSKVEVMDKSADGQRDFDAFVMSAKGETSTRKLSRTGPGASRSRWRLCSPMSLARRRWEKNSGMRP